jgi:hypothetical protein
MPEFARTGSFSWFLPGAAGPIGCGNGRNEYPHTSGMRSNPHKGVFEDPGNAAMMVRKPIASLPLHENTKNYNLLLPWAVSRNPSY